MNRHRIEEVEGCPFPVDTLADRVPLAWFLEQGATPADILEVLHPLLMTEEDVPFRSVSTAEAWNLLDELICRDAIPGPIHRYKAPKPHASGDESEFADIWNSIWG